MGGKIEKLPLLGDGMNQLIIFRAIQGLGGAGLFAMAFIIIADLFPPAERGRYSGYTGAVFGTSSVLGPVIGGFLTDKGTNLIPGVEGWRLVFYVNLPIGLAALWFITKYMPALKPATKPKKFDFFSALLLIVGLAQLVIALQLNKAIYGWASPTTLGLFAGATLLLTLFVIRSLRHENPILNFGLFKNENFRKGNMALFVLGGAFLGVIIFEPLFMVNVLGRTATQAGISLIPLSLGVVSASLLSGQMVSRFGHYKYWMLSGITILLTGLFLLYTMPVDVQYYQVLIYLAICGFGLGPTMPLYTLSIQNATEPRLMGQATSASQFFRQIGGAIAASVLGTVFTIILAKHLPGQISEASIHGAASEGGTAAPHAISTMMKVAFTDAIHQVYLCNIVLVIIGMIITFTIPEIPLRKSNEVKPEVAA